MAEPVSKDLDPDQFVELLKRTLDKLGNLDLSGRVTFDRSKPMKDGGFYGNVYTGTYDSPEHGKTIAVAIKCLRQVSPSVEKVAAKEIYIWSKLDHPNLLRLLGFIKDEGNLPSLVSEWMNNGSVLEYVKSHPDCDVIHLILGIAKGLENTFTRGT
ncbi:hypothetical protein M0805_008733 [Coniferiporia weirii]|nr:hypothetical protein M0805_008733 [Coniferiporia weirii]